MDVGLARLALLALADVVDRAACQHADDARHAFRRCGEVGVVLEVQAPLLILGRIRLLDRRAELERATRGPSPMRRIRMSDQVHQRVLEELDPLGREAVGSAPHPSREEERLRVVLREPDHEPQQAGSLGLHRQVAWSVRMAFGRHLADRNVHDGWRGHVLGRDHDVSLEEPALGLHEHSRALEGDRTVVAVDDGVPAQHFAPPGVLAHPGDSKRFYHVVHDLEARHDHDLVVYVAHH